MSQRKSITKQECVVLRKLLKEAKEAGEFKRIQSVLLRGELGLTAIEIGKAVGISAGTVRQIHYIYFKKGVDSLLSKDRGGRRNENMTIAQEKKFLKRYLDKAKAGKILIVSEIKIAYEKELGRTVAESTIYRMLARHGWRKIAPRSSHPKSDPKKREEFKKNLRK